MSSKDKLTIHGKFIGWKFIDIFFLQLLMYYYIIPFLKMQLVLVLLAFLHFVNGLITSEFMISKIGQFCINENFKYISLIDMTTNPSSLANIEHQKKLMEMDLRLKLIFPTDIEKLEVNNLLDVLSKYQTTKSKYSKQLLKKKK